MDTDLLKPHPGATHKKKRVGRGSSSGHGGTSTRGHKGQKSRGKIHKWFEGGQMPLVRRIPKRGFHPPRREKPLTVNVERLNIFKGGSEVDPEVMRKAGLVSSRRKIKILGIGELNHSLKVKAHGFSREARRKIEEAKGEAEVI